MTGDISYYHTMHAGLKDELANQGFGGGVALPVQKPAPDTMAWTNAARKFVAYDVNVIVTYGAPSTLCALKETGKIPIVFAGVPNPAELGISNGNVTGVASTVSFAGLIKHLKGISDFSRLGVIYSRSEPDTVRQAEEVEKLETKFAFKTVKYDLRGSSGKPDLGDVNAVFITTCAAAMRSIESIITQARAKNIPTAAVVTGGEEKGILLTLCADPETQGREAGKMVASLLMGEDPSAIKSKTSGKVQMVINLKEAKALGLTIPFDLLASATKVIK